MRKNKKGIWIGIIVVVVLGAIILLLPPVWSRVSYHIKQVYDDIVFKINAPQKVVFNPGQSTPDDVATAVQATLNAMQPSITSTPESTLQPTFTPTATLPPLPASKLLEGVRPEAQMWNNCGPATLSMNLSYWGWSGDQEDAAAILKPNQQDKNVMPYEIADFVNENTEFRALVRMGGDLYTLKALVNAGFPVLLEKGYDPLGHSNEELGWMGHYNLVIGYDDAAQKFITQDSYLLALMEYSQRALTKGFDVTYANMQQNWLAFNYVFIVVYPPDYENDVLNLLGPLADENNAFQIAYNRALSESASLTNPRDQYFAWFNAGTSLVKLQDYTGAASAYDKAFSIYLDFSENNTIDLNRRPYRMLWYQTGPYFAYYYTARYQDVTNLASITLDTEKGDEVLEESFHWRALAELELGQYDAAVADLREALRVHPDFAPSYEQLVALGETP